MYMTVMRTCTRFLPGDAPFSTISQHHFLFCMNHFKLLGTEWIPSFTLSLNKFPTLVSFHHGHIHPHTCMHTDALVGCTWHSEHIYIIIYSKVIQWVQLMLHWNIQSCHFMSIVTTEIMEAASSHIPTKCLYMYFTRMTVVTFRGHEVQIPSPW